VCSSDLTSIPSLYLLIIIASVIEPNFWILLGILLLFSWVALVGVVRAEFLRARNFDYVRAAHALVAHEYSPRPTHCQTGENGPLVVSASILKA